MCVMRASRQAFKATAKGKGRLANSAVGDIWLHCLFFALLAASIGVGIWQLVVGDTVISTLLVRPPPSRPSRPTEVHSHFHDIAFLFQYHIQRSILRSHRVDIHSRLLLTLTYPCCSFPGRPPPHTTELIARCYRPGFLSPSVAKTHQG